MYGKRLQELRTNRGLSQTELAGILGTNQQNIARWEKEVNAPNRSAMDKITKYFGVSVDYIYGKTVEPVGNKITLLDIIFRDQPEIADMLKDVTISSKGTILKDNEAVADIDSPYLLSCKALILQALQDAVDKGKPTTTVTLPNRG